MMLALCYWPVIRQSQQESFAATPVPLARRGWLVSFTVIICVCLLLLLFFFFVRSCLRNRHVGHPPATSSFMVMVVNNDGCVSFLGTLGLCSRKSKEISRGGGHYFKLHLVFMMCMQAIRMAASSLPVPNLQMMEQSE